MTITKLATPRVRLGLVCKASQTPFPRPVLGIPRVQVSHLHQTSNLPERGERHLHRSLRNCCRPASTTSAVTPTSMEPSSIEAGNESMDGVVTAPLDIIRSLDEKFEAAKSAGDVLFFPSTVHTHQEGGVDVFLFQNFISTQNC